LIYLKAKPIQPEPFEKEKDEELLLPWRVADANPGANKPRLATCGITSQQDFHSLKQSSHVV